ncbi:low molecular weight protein arginine phosphatase [Haloferula sp. A504]|uniref:low molecular weight protein arginine phosphatase n=1 Tax=Haloferula sp. A504 TaxID=3373601 RepID=UPI0031C2FB02|nr:low molecular weight protein arginine phosphatase [Verrucomicrobiaceae bacterium E54]
MPSVLRVAAMAEKKSVLFVCTGNTCRSPMAEGLFRAAVAGRDDFEVASAGVSAGPGGRISPDTDAILRARGAGIDGFASQAVSEELIKKASHVFAMTGQHLAVLHRMFPEHEDKFYLTCEFVDLPGRGVGCDVPDPIGSGPAAYREVAETLDQAIPTLIAFIDQTSG